MSGFPGSLRLQRPRRHTKIIAGAVLTLVCAVLLPAGSSSAATEPGLGTAASFAVLGASTVTNTGPSEVDGDLGSPGSVTGFPPGTVSGDIHATDAIAVEALAAAGTAYTALSGPAQACDVDLTGSDLGGLTLAPGTYCFSSAAQLTGALTLDAAGDPDAVFVFQIGSTLTTASSSSVAVINAGNPCKVYWQVGSSATLGTGTDFVGTVIAAASITATTGVGVAGRLLALSGAVTLDINSITSCADGGTDGATTGGTGGTTTGGTGGTTTGGTGGTTTGGTDGATSGGATGGTTAGGTDGTTAGGTGGTTTGGTDGATSGGATGGGTDGTTAGGTGGTTGGTAGGTGGPVGGVPISGVPVGGVPVGGGPVGGVPVGGGPVGGGGPSGGVVADAAIGRMHQRWSTRTTDGRQDLPITGGAHAALALVGTVLLVVGVGMRVVPTRRHVR